MPGIWKEIKNRKLVTAVLINGFVLAMFLILFSPVYEVNDDSALCNLVNGSLGVYDPHVIFQNVFLGFLYTHLYQITAAIPWYALVQYLCLFLSLTTLTFCFMDYLEHRAYLGLIISILLVFGYDLYVRPQFSKTAAALVVAGLTLLFYTLFQERIRKRNLALGILLAWAGAMYRMSVFKCNLLLFSAVVLYLLINLKNYKREEARRRFITGLVTGTLLLAVVFGSDLFDQYSYRSESWSYYREFNSQRVKLSDYGFPEYKNHEKEYQEIGFDLSAIKLLRRWTFQDAERYNAESLRKIAELKKEVAPAAKPGRAFLTSFPKGLLRGLKDLTVFWCFAVTALVCLIWGKSSIRKWIALVWEMAAVLAVYGYTYYKGRFMMHRIDVGIWLAVLAIVLLIYRPEKTGKLKPVCISLASLVFLFSMGYHWNQLKINTGSRDRSREANRKVIEAIHADREHLYLKTIGTVSFYKAYGVFDPTPVGIGDNQYPLGGWMAQTETARSVLDAYPVHNPLVFRDMIDNDRVLLIDKNIDIMVEYLRYWYDKDARAEKVDRIGKWNVYKIVTK